MMDPHALRATLGHFPTGVAVVTTHDADFGPVGVTVSSFNAVSLEPALVLFSIGNASPCRRSFDAARGVAVHVLGHDQHELSARFARGGTEKWAGLDYARGKSGSPLLNDALAVFECRPYARYEGGDHTIFVVEVESMTSRGGEPLVFCRGSYRALAQRAAC
jgi:flavin reductase (DIM6/NTAB) family NADH-FMN oxidoreductase RutF